MADTHASHDTSPGYDLVNGPKQPYHLVNPSPWPLLSALSGGLMLLGIIFYVHPDLKIFGAPLGMKGVYVGLALVVACMFGWWRDVLHEAVVEHAHSPLVKIGLRYGMSLFIASEVMFFVAFFWAYFDSGLFPKEAIGFTWPPKGIATVAPFGTPFLMTLILLLSGTTVTWAHHELNHDNKRGATLALIVTVLLGLSFTGFQAYEYLHAEFGFEDTVFASTFYMATGFHGFHVIVGTIFLAVCLLRTMAGQFSSKSMFGFEAASWYWHFVDVVWLFLFVAVYWWGSAPAVAG